jgi:hypothetical protein
VNSVRHVALTLPRGGPGLRAVILKVGTLDELSLFGDPLMAIYAIDRQPFHIILENLPIFERGPPR